MFLWPCLRHELLSTLSTSSSGNFLSYSRYRTETDHIREFCFNAIDFISQEVATQTRGRHSRRLCFLYSLFQNVPPRDKKPLSLLCTSSSCPTPSLFHLSRGSPPPNTTGTLVKLNPCNKPEDILTREIACGLRKRGALRGKFKLKLEEEVNQPRKVGGKSRSGSGAARIKGWRQGHKACS